MKTYELIEVDLTPCGNGLPERRTVIAVGSETLLDQYVKREFNKPVGKPDTFTWDNYYEIHPSTIKVLV